MRGAPVPAKQSRLRAFRARTGCRRSQEKTVAPVPLCAAPWFASRCPDPLSGNRSTVRARGLPLPASAVPIRRLGIASNSPTVPRAHFSSSSRRGRSRPRVRCVGRVDRRRDPSERLVEAVHLYRWASPLLWPRSKRALTSIAASPASAARTACDLLANRRAAIRLLLARFLIFSRPVSVLHCCCFPCGSTAGSSGRSVCSAVQQDSSRLGRRFRWRQKADQHGDGPNIRGEAGARVGIRDALAAGPVALVRCLAGRASLDACRLRRVVLHGRVRVARLRVQLLARANKMSLRVGGGEFLPGVIFRAGQLRLRAQIDAVARWMRRRRQQRVWRNGPISPG